MTEKAEIKYLSEAAQIIRNIRLDILFSEEGDGDMPLDTCGPFAEQHLIHACALLEQAESALKLADLHSTRERVAASGGMP